MTVSDASLRRAGLMRFAESATSQCSKPWGDPGDNLNGGLSNATFSLPYINQACVAAILQTDDVIDSNNRKTDDPNHVLTSEDIITLTKWYRNNRHVEGGTELYKWDANGDTVAELARWEKYTATIVVPALVGKKVSELPATGPMEFHKGSLTETVDQVAGAMRFITDPTNWLAMGGLAIGLVLVVYGGSRYLRGGQ